MFVFAAHTGARRSEIIRSQIEDIDLTTRNITIREKKRVRGRFSTRTVPMSPILFAAMKNWLVIHPGGDFTFEIEAISRSKAQRMNPMPITRDEAHDHFKRTLAGSRWEKLRGWHVFRHSFASNCAAAGVDQRIINAWLGHQTEEMVRRYRHLIPNQAQAAIRTVFDNEQKA
jgi:integrase